MTKVPTAWLFGVGVLALIRCNAVLGINAHQLAPEGGVNGVGGESSSGATTGGSEATGGSGATGGSMGSLTGGMSGVGGSAGAPATVCAANQPTCDGNRAATCNPEGTGYLVVGSQCSTTQACLNGACEDHKCTPSSVSCQAQELKTCAANGLSSTSQPCQMNATCPANAGSVACVCKPGYSGTGVSCTATLCLANQGVRDNACEACGAGTTNASGDDASGANTTCDTDPPSCQGLAANCGAVVGSVSPKGNGLYGQADLAGNVWEWNLDWYATKASASCNNCANSTVASNRVIRGGSFGYPAGALLSSARFYDAPAIRSGNIGLRCARTP